jgi:hypothetical protein
MSMFGWIGRKSPEPAEAKPSVAVNKLPKIDKDAARRRARENSPWRFDDGPSRRPVGSK